MSPRPPTERERSDPLHAAAYAQEIGERVPELEPVIALDSQYARWYAAVVVKGRFVLGEAAIARTWFQSYLYLKVIGIIPDTPDHRSERWAEVVDKWRRLKGWKGQRTPGCLHEWFPLGEPPVR